MRAISQDEISYTPPSRYHFLNVCHAGVYAFPKRFVALVALVALVTLVSFVSFVSVVSLYQLVHKKGSCSGDTSYSRNSPLMIHQEKR
jgi:hypothetical protein